MKLEMSNINNEFKFSDSRFTCKSNSSYIHIIYLILWKSAENLFHANLPSTRENWILYKFMNFAAVQDVPS